MRLNALVPLIAASSLTVALIAARSGAGAPRTLMAASAASTQGFRRFVWEPNVPYDGKFTFARLSYTVYGGRSGWEYDYPAMERHLMTMLQEITELHPHQSGSNIHAMDDPELLKYPVAYLSEPGYWHASESEATGLRTWLAKGGFLIVDDFMYNEWYNFEREMLRVLPWADIVPLPLTHPVFDSFFKIETLEMPYPGRPQLMAEFYGIFEDNDPSKRLMVVINYNNDIGDYMEWSDENFWPVNITNDAYKFAINYIVYGMTH